MLHCRDRFAEEWLLTIVDTAKILFVGRISIGCGACRQATMIDMAFVPFRLPPALLSSSHLRSDRAFGYPECITLYDISLTVALHSDLKMSPSFVSMDCLMESIIEAADTSLLYCYGQIALVTMTDLKLLAARW